MSFQRLIRALALAFAALWLTATASFAAPPEAAAEPRWTAHGFNINAPQSMWPMLELLHEHRFHWALDAASRSQAPIVWSDMPNGVYGLYSTDTKVIKLANALTGTGVEAGAAYLAHELTHLNDDLNGLLPPDLHGTACYQAETRAFVNEANLWSMIFGKNGKRKADAIERQENTKMFAFLGNERFADLVVRTTGSYIAQCGK